MAATLAPTCDSARPLGRIAAPKPPAGDWERIETLPFVPARGRQFTRRMGRAIMLGARQGQLRPRHVQLLHYMLDAVPEGGHTLQDRTRRRIARDLNCSIRTISSTHAELRAWGWLSWRHHCHRTRAGNIRQRANEYLLQLPPWVQSEFDKVGRRRARPDAMPRRRANDRAGDAVMPPAPDPHAGIVQPDDLVGAVVGPAPSSPLARQAAEVLRRVSGERSPP